ncbi:MAG: phosphatidylserine decarboxylase [Candidatus Woesearchaeota archaeon]|nr:phosphatidylserine decarboxylase [Candidatus Woesearchaeota archaeon]
MVIALIYVSLLFTAAAFLFYSYTLRNPLIEPTPGNNIVSPAHGKIARIIRTTRKYVTLQKGWGKIKTLTEDVDNDCFLIDIVMHLSDVHFQKAPTTGTILYTHHEKGKWKNAVRKAYTMKAALENEKNEILMNTHFGKIKVIQIAGYVARRIRCFVKKNDHVEKGQSLGVIKMGSQVTLIFPAKYKLAVHEGQKVVGGKTVIATNERWLR